MQESNNCLLLIFSRSFFLHLAYIFLGAKHQHSYKRLRFQVGPFQIAVFEVYIPSSFVASDRRFGDRVPWFFKCNQETVVMYSSESLNKPITLFA